MEESYEINDVLLLLIRAHESNTIFVIYANGETRQTLMETETPLQQHREISNLNDIKYVYHHPLSLSCHIS